MNLPQKRLLRTFSPVPFCFFQVLISIIHSVNCNPHSSPHSPGSHLLWRRTQFLPSPDWSQVLQSGLFTIPCILVLYQQSPFNASLPPFLLLAKYKNQPSSSYFYTPNTSAAKMSWTLIRNFLSYSLFDINFSLFSGIQKNSKTSQQGLIGADISVKTVIAF